MKLTDTIIALALNPMGHAGMAFYPPSAGGLRTDVGTNAVITTHKSDTEWIIPTYKTPDAGYVDLIRQLNARASYLAMLPDGWDGEGSLKATLGSSSAARAFIDMLPLDLLPPRAMLDPCGELGFYWDLPGGSADITFAESGLGSFFSRTQDGRERFVEDLGPESFSREWFFKHLGEMDWAQRRAA